MNSQERYIIVFMLNEKLSEREVKKFRLFIQALIGEPVDKNADKVDMIELANRKGYLKKMVAYFKFDWQALVDEFHKTHMSEPEAL